MNYYTPVKNTTTFTSDYSNKWQPFRSECRPRKDHVRKLQIAIYMQKKGNESAVVDVVIFYMEIVHKLRLYWMMFGLKKVIN